MSIIIGCIVIASFKVVQSQEYQQMCVYGHILTENYVEGILGEYNSDYNYNDESGAWSMSVGANCDIGEESDTVYLRWRKTGNTKYRWEISWNLDLNDYWYYTISYDPESSDAPLTQWYDRNGEIVYDLIVSKGKCQPSPAYDTIMPVTGYSGALQGCNGNFISVDGKKNLFKRTQGYDYGWNDESGEPTGPIDHYWLYNYNEQRWVCDYLRDWEDPSMNGYENACYY